MASKEVGNLKVSMSLESANVNQSLSSVERNIKTVGQELSIIRAKGKDFGDSLDGLQTKNETLGRTLELQEDRVKKLREAYEKSRDEKGKDAKATEDLATKLNKAIAEYTRTEKEIEDVNEALNKQVTDLNQAESKWDKYAGAADKAADKVKAAGDRMKDIGEQATLALTVPITAGLGFAGKIANEFDSAQGRLQAQLGLTEEQAGKLAGTAENLFTNAFGDSIGEVASDLALVKQNMQGIADVDLEKTAERAYILRDAFNAEINESTRTASVLMKNFEIDAGTAFDLITTGFQRGGNFSDELLDTLREYAPQFAGMGYDAEEFTAILIAGAEAGAFNLDKVGDAAKEAFLRIGDGSEGSREALGDLGLDFKKIEKDINSGGDSAKAAFAAVTSAIASIEDPAQRAQTAVALLGTPVEDLGPEFQTFFANVNTDLGEFEGATDRAGDALYDNFGTRATEQWRRFTTSLEPAGEILLDLAEDILPKVAEATEKALKWFEGLDEEGQKTVLAMAGIAAGAGPVMTGLGFVTSGLGNVIKGAGDLVGVLGKTGGKGLLGRLSLMGPTAGPVGIAIGGAAALTLGILAVKDASEEAANVNLDYAESLIDQQQTLDDLISKYEVLQAKNMLSNEELLRFRDIQSELKTATTKDEIASLKDEAAALAEKSGLSNEEMTEFLSLNDELIEKVPEASRAFSTQGEAILTNADDLKAANEALRENIALELEVQKTKAEAKLDENIRDNIAAYEELNSSIVDLNNAKIEGEAIEYRIGELTKAQQQARQDGQDAFADSLDREIETLEAILNSNQGNIETLAEEVEVKAESLGKTQEQIEKTQALYDEMINLQLASVGINETGQEGIAILDTTLEKSQERIGELNAARDAQGGLNEEQQQELDNLLEAVGYYQNAKEEVQNIQAEQSSVNDRISEGKDEAGEMSRILSQNEVKDIQFTGDGYEDAKIITDELDEDVKKEVEVTDYGKANDIHKKAGESAFKTVFVTVQETAARIFEGAASRILPGFATGTRNAPGGLSMVGEEGPELVYLPTGARVVPTDDTEQLLSKWNIPTSQPAATTSASVQPVGDTYNFDRMFEGASIQVRSDQDIKQLAKEIHALTQQQKRRAVL